MITKLFVCPYFGDMPSWMDHYWRNARRLRAQGYDFLVDTDEEAFHERVKDRLGITCPTMVGTGKTWDFRPALGVLYEEEIRGYDFWGHTDFDCVYGRVEEWVTDAFLSDLDIHSNHHNYICGFWTLYRNQPFVNELFSLHPEWQEIMESATPYGWAETGFTEIVDTFAESGELAREYTFWQTKNLNNYDLLHWEDGKLMEGNTEVMVAHFRRTKEYPPRCIL